MLLLTATTLLTAKTIESYKTKDDDNTDRRRTYDNRNITTYRTNLSTNKEESYAGVANPISNMKNESALRPASKQNNGRINGNYGESNGGKIDLNNGFPRDKTNNNLSAVIGAANDTAKNESNNFNDVVDHFGEGKSFGIDHKLGEMAEVHIFEDYDFGEEHEDEIVIEVIDDAVDAKSSETHIYLERKALDNAVDFGINSVEELVHIKEPMWYQMGLFLDSDHPASRVATFGNPINNMALTISRFGYLTLEASRKLAESFPENVSRQASGFPGSFRPRQLQDECPLKGIPRCPTASRRYRTADGSCNNLRDPWKGSAMLPMHRFLPPAYDDGIQSVRRSVFGTLLPSARDISSRIHPDKNHEIPTVTLIFVQWGQFIDHDVTSAVKSRSFGGSVPRCCDKGGKGMLPPELLHPSCLPIEVPKDDWFLSRFGVRCMEFIRSAPSTRIDCDLGWREQINQVTPYIDASTIYGSDIETSHAVRTLKNGKLIYGRPRDQPLRPPDPPEGELCRAGVITEDCFQPGDGRLAEQPALTAFHTVWIRFHNRMATVLSRLNAHWSDEKIFQETRKIVYSVIQHITYREFLPIVVGPEVMELFELNLVQRGYYEGYKRKVNPAIANSFSSAAYRFGHSMVQNSYLRTDHKHRPLFNNVTLHEELNNIENIWSFGSLDRLLLGLANQPSQRRDEFICDELSNHLFQSPDAPFGMDLTAINIQRGRDHGIPSYTAWRQPCGLSAIKNWKDLERIFNARSVANFRSLYKHVDDIDLFSGGLAEKPVRGGVVGPTFACIIAQQFSNLRKGDRFWYENGGFESSFTPAQLQQIKRTSFAHIICQTSSEIETIQPFVFLSPDDVRNVRLPCDSPELNNFDLAPWTEREFDEIDDKLDFRKRDNTDHELTSLSRKMKRRKSTNKTKNKKKKTTTETPLKLTVTNITTKTVKYRNKYSGSNIVVDSIPDRPSFLNYKPQNYDETNYLVQNSPTKYEKPVEVNIKIQYFLPATEATITNTTKRKRKKPTARPTNIYADDNAILITQRPSYPVFFTNRWLQ
ncbi:hypothetical protein NQ317_015772 [Molorchus minor]|uniref:Chorion peroxidase n=1 Tax=Molorchus minor TaxID=1323400 RepID=A0ABQ9K585_9CUCU|nr:hypothetical protein NQ317_015772 [Molorchus minor]